MDNTYSKTKNQKNQNQQVPMNGEIIKMPKNIRQIGTITGHNKAIYVEDYVMTFMKQLAQKDPGGCRIAVLLGYYVRTEIGKNLFIKGAVEMKNGDIGKGSTFSDESWTSIYENIKKYFTDVEIVGWSLVGPGFFLDTDDKIKKAHTSNFAGPDKTLLKIDSIEKEEAFYLFENNQLVKQTGYYIYYEKNEEMQSYMVENKEVVVEEMTYCDQTTRKIRNIIQEKKETKEDKSVIRLLYAASTLMAIIVLVIAAAMLNNYDQIRNMKQALNTISENLIDASANNNQNRDQSKNNNVEKDPVVMTTTNKGKEEDSDIEAVDNSETMEVETVSGNLTVIEDTSNQPQKVVTENDTAKEDAAKEAAAKEEAAKEAAAKEAAAKEEAAKEAAAKEAAEKEEAAKEAAAKEAAAKEAAEKEAAKETKAEIKYYVVRSGDSLAGISYELYNSANYIKVIKELNGIEDENKIYEGQKLIVP